MILSGDCRDVLPTLETGSAHLSVTSPPYLEQRIYGDDPAELGHEDTVAEYVRNLADVLDEVGRILRPDGSLWLNIGDKANGSGGSGGDWKAGDTVKGRARKVRAFRDPSYPVGSYLDVPGQIVAELLRRRWRLRLPIVWHKGQQAPEDLRHVRRPRWSHEMIYLLAPPGSTRMKFYPSGLVETGSVWTFPAGGSGDSHLAPFPDELARRAILAGTLPGDVVLDPFAGSGTVPRVAAELGRRAIGIELYHDRKATT